MKNVNIKKLLILNIPYILLGLFATNLGEAWRLAEGADMSAKLLGFFDTFMVALSNPLPSFHPMDLVVGIICGAGLRLAVYLKGKNAKKYRHNEEYGSARWGTAKDIEPFMDQKFEDNIILTKTERLMMSNRPKNPANARNKNVLIIGGSGSGKTRFWLKPNLLQMHSSYVVTDPKGSIVIECGNALLNHNFNIKIFNSIYFKKSMHYNPFAYIHSEKDILKLVTTLIANTKGDGKAGDEFWTKAETLLYCALIGYIHYEAPVEEQNFSTLIEFLNAMEVREDDEEFQNPVDMMFEALEKSMIPIKIFRPPHVNRRKGLLEEGYQLLEKGGYIDLTCGISEDFCPGGCILEAKEKGIPTEHITISSDGHGSWSKYREDGSLLEIGVSSVDALREEFLYMVHELDMKLEDALPYMTSHVAEALGLQGKKGTIQKGADADLLLWDNDLKLDSYIAGGKIFMQKEKIICKGTYEK